ncbi:hypothetical protein KJ652_07255 [Patescibacteria group bacterium]|nr:hypothetical protein [Patescibacteria group bacterium]MBU1124346.1 hypothetical protein [Patescibacteria group bacterium]MBU1911589.1 hypothetical protein [Patescibacteria group bacterium]
MKDQNRVVVGALIGVIIGALIGAGFTHYNRTVAFMGINPEFAKQMESLRTIDPDDPKYRSDVYNPIEFDERDTIHYAPSYTGSEECRQFKMPGPRYTDCIMKDQKVLPTPLPYEDKSGE